MTYGWALIVIAIVIGVLIYVTSGSMRNVTCQTSTTQLILKEWSFGKAVDTVGFTFQNATGGAIDVDPDGDDSTCVGTTFTAPISDALANSTCAATAGGESVAHGATFVVQLLDSTATGTFTGGTADVRYKTAGGLTAIATVSCSGAV